jgi:hypothetical protein
MYTVRPCRPVRRALLATTQRTALRGIGHSPEGVWPQWCVRACACRGQRSTHAPPGLSHGRSAGADPGLGKKEEASSARHASACAVLALLSLAVPRCPARQGPRAWRASCQRVCTATSAATRGAPTRAPHALFFRHASQGLAQTKSSSPVRPRLHLRWVAFMESACASAHAHALAPSLPAAMGRCLAGKQQSRLLRSALQNWLVAHPAEACELSSNESGSMRAGAHACAAGDGGALRRALPAAQVRASAAPYTVCSRRMPALGLPLAQPRARTSFQLSVGAMRARVPATPRQPHSSSSDPAAAHRAAGLGAAAPWRLSGTLASRGAPNVRRSLKVHAAPRPTRGAGARRRRRPGPRPAAPAPRFQAGASSRARRCAATRR